MSCYVSSFTGDYELVSCNGNKGEDLTASQQKEFPCEQKTTDELQDFDVIRDVLGGLLAKLEVDGNVFSGSSFHVKKVEEKEGVASKVWKKVFKEPMQKIPSPSLEQVASGNSSSSSQQITRKRTQEVAQNESESSIDEGSAQKKKTLTRQEQEKSVFNTKGHIYIPNENNFVGAGKYGRVYGVIRPVSVSKPVVVKTFCLNNENDTIISSSYKQELDCYYLMEKFIANRKNVTVCKGNLNASHFVRFERISPFAGLVFEKYSLKIQNFYNKNRNLETFRRITNQMMDVLNYLSNGLGDKSIVHRDLRPDNMMIDDKGDLKLIDFGVALIIEKGSVIPACSINTNNYHLTPEEAFDLDYDITSDLWKAVTMLHDLKFNVDIIYPQNHSENNKIPSLNTLLRVCGKLPKDVKKAIVADARKLARFDFAMNDYFKTRKGAGKSKRDILEQSPEKFWNRHFSYNISQKIDKEEDFSALIDFMKQVFTYRDTRAKVEDLMSHSFLQREPVASSS
jgi:serine/threonine protein kinase